MRSNLGDEPVNFFKDLQIVLGASCCHINTIRKWVERFSSGNMNLKDDPSCPTKVSSTKTIFFDFFNMYGVLLVDILPNDTTICSECITTVFPKLEYSVFELIKIVTTHLPINQGQ